jgi:hypothetical protein
MSAKSYLEIELGRTGRLDLFCNPNSEGVSGYTQVCY